MEHSILFVFHTTSLLQIRTYITIAGLCLMYAAQTSVEIHLSSFAKLFKFQLSSYTNFGGFLFQAARVGFGERVG